MVQTVHDITSANRDSCRIIVDLLLLIFIFLRSELFVAAAHADLQLYRLPLSVALSMSAFGERGREEEADSSARYETSLNFRALT